MKLGKMLSVGEVVEQPAAEEPTAVPPAARPPAHPAPASADHPDTQPSADPVVAAVDR